MENNEPINNENTAETAEAPTTGRGRSRHRRPPRATHTDEATTDTATAEVKVATPEAIEAEASVANRPPRHRRGSRARANEVVPTQVETPVDASIPEATLTPTSVPILEAPTQPEWRPQENVAPIAATNIVAQNDETSVTEAARPQRRYRFDRPAPQHVIKPTPTIPERRTLGPLSTIWSRPTNDVPPVVTESEPAQDEVEEYETIISLTPEPITRGATPQTFEETPAPELPSAISDAASETSIPELESFTDFSDSDGGANDANDNANNGNNRPGGRRRRRGRGNGNGNSNGLHAENETTIAPPMAASAPSAPVQQPRFQPTPPPIVIPATPTPTVTYTATPSPAPTPLYQQPTNQQQAPTPTYTAKPTPTYPPVATNYEAATPEYVTQSNTGDSANPSPYGSPEPAHARGFGPPQRGVASEYRPMPAPRVSRAERNNDGGAPFSPNHLAAILMEAIQQQTDRLLNEQRRNSSMPVFTVALPSTERVGVFVDVANLLYSSRSMRIPIDFGKLLTFLRSDRRLVRAHAYCPTSPDPYADQQFLTAVKGLGYRITTKDYKTFSSGAKKADLDLDLCMDIVRIVDADAVDTVVLVSGDSDFLPLLDYCSDHGVRVEVAAFDESTAAILRQSCDLFMNLSLVEDIRA